MTTLKDVMLTDWWRLHYHTISWTSPLRVGVKFYTRNPVFSEETAERFATFTGLGSIDEYPEYVPSTALVDGIVAGESAFLYVKKISTNSTTVALQIVDGVGDPVDLEDLAGFSLAATPPAEGLQEIISSAVFYLVGTYSGVVNPIIFATTQGVGKATVVHDGALFGQTRTQAVEGYENILNMDVSVDSATAINITNRARSSGVATITTSTNHGYAVGNVVTVASTGASTFNGTFLVTAVPSSTSFSYVTGSTDVASTSSSGTVKLRPDGWRPTYLLLQPSLPYWESAHAQHLWLEPQRTNLLANPSFEDAALENWRVDEDSTLARAAGIDDGIRSYCGHVTGSNPTKVLESNYFPVTGSWLSVVFYIRAASDDETTSSLKYGIVGYDASYSNTVFISSDTVDLPHQESGGFLEIRGLIPSPPNTAEMCLRIEVDNCSEFWVDNAMVDPHEGQYTYFDGDSTDGLIGDYRWMGGSTNTNKHFSCWYNNYKNNRYRLMGDYDTDDDLYKPGLVEEWAPTGANIVAHWDAVTSFTPLNWWGDAYYPLAAVSGTSVSNIDTETDFFLVPRD